MKNQRFINTLLIVAIGFVGIMPMFAPPKGSRKVKFTAEQWTEIRDQLSSHNGLNYFQEPVQNVGTLNVGSLNVGSLNVGNLNVGTLNVPSGFSDIPFDIDLLGSQPSVNLHRLVLHRRTYQGPHVQPGIMDDERKNTADEVSVADQAREFYNQETRYMNDSVHLNINGVRRSRNSEAVIRLIQQIGLFLARIERLGADLSVNDQKALEELSKEIGTGSKSRFNRSGKLLSKSNKDRKWVKGKNGRFHYNGSDDLRAKNYMIQQRIAALISQSPSNTSNSVSSSSRGSRWTMRTRYDVEELSTTSQGNLGFN